MLILDWCFCTFLNINPTPPNIPYSSSSEIPSCQKAFLSPVKLVVAPWNAERYGSWNHAEIPRTLGREPIRVFTHMLCLFTLQFGENLPENLRLWGNLINYDLNRCLCLLYLLIQAAGGTRKWRRARRRACQRKTCSLVLSLKAVKLCARLWASETPTLCPGNISGTQMEALQYDPTQKPLLPFLLMWSTRFAAEKSPLVTP